MYAVGAPQDDVHQHEDDELLFVAAHGTELSPGVLKTFRAFQIVELQREYLEENEPHHGNEQDDDRHADGGPLKEGHVHASHVAQKLHGEDVHGRARRRGDTAHEHADGKSYHDGAGKVAPAGLAFVLLHDLKSDGGQHDHHGHVGHEGGKNGASSDEAQKQAGRTAAGKA